jgi:hypothetical protein
MVSLTILGACAASSDPASVETAPPDVPAAGPVVAALGSTGGWDRALIANADERPGVVRRVIPLSVGGFAAIVGENDVYFWNGALDWRRLPTVGAGAPGYDSADPTLRDLVECGGRLFVIGDIVLSVFDDLGGGLGGGVGTLLKDRFHLASRSLLELTSDTPWTVDTSFAADFGIAQVLECVPSPASTAGLYVGGTDLTLDTVVSEHVFRGNVGGGGWQPLRSLSLDFPRADDTFPGVRVLHAARLSFGPGEAPRDVVLAGGAFLASSASSPTPIAGGYGLAAWDGSQFLSVAGGIVPHFAYFGCTGDACLLTLTNSVTALATHDGDLYVAGEFTQVVTASGPLTVNRFARLRSGAWQVLRPGVGYDSPGIEVLEIPSRMVASGDSIYLMRFLMGPGLGWMTGHMTSPAAPFGVAEGNGVVRWVPSSGRWAHLEGGTDGRVFDLVDRGADGVLLGGEFIEVGRFDAASSSIANTILSPFVAAWRPSGECLGDFNDDSVVDGGDLGLLLSEWGTPNRVSDIDGDGVTGGADIGSLLSAWGPCD